MRVMLKFENSSWQGRESLADSWVDFLIEQAQAADAAEGRQPPKMAPAT